MGLWASPKASPWRGRVSLVCLLALLPVTACGSQTRTSHQTPPPLGSVSHSGARAPTETDRHEIESIVVSLFTALSHKNYTSACNDYTPNIQATVILAAKKLYGREFPTCAASLAAITSRSPGASSVHLGRPRFSALSIRGNIAGITFSSRLSNGLVAHSDVVVMREFGRWKVDRATSLRFSG